MQPNISKKARADPGFQDRGAHLKKLRRAEGGANIFGVFRVKNHDFTPKNHIFSNFTLKNHIFSNFRGGGGGGAPGAPLPGSAPGKVIWPIGYPNLHLGTKVNEQHILNSSFHSQVAVPS